MAQDQVVQDLAVFDWICGQNTNSRLLPAGLHHHRGKIAA